MENENNKKESFNRTAEILTFPPVAILPIVLLGMLFQGMNPIDSFPISLAATQLFIYAALTVANMTWMKKGKYKMAVSASLTANGLLIVFVSAELNTHVLFGWVGLLMLFIGVVALISQLSPPQAVSFPKRTSSILPPDMTKKDLKKLLSAIPFPSAMLKANDKGEDVVLEANEPLSAILGMRADDMTGRAFSSLVPNYQGVASFKYANAEWISHKSTGGRETLFILSPAVKLEKRENGGFEPKDMGGGIVDEGTGIYTKESMEHIAKYAVQECRRYNNRLTTLLLKLEFNGKSIVPPSDEAKGKAFRAFAGALSLLMRPCDSAFLTDNDCEVIVFMPDSSLDKTKTFVEQIHDSIRKLAAIECVELGLARLVDASVNAVGEDVLSADQMAAEARLEMKRKYKD
ncbi:MAG: hypothetical protein LBS75_00525 [Synergistaceae bacterium]|jgi:hypothetical protein|nr:hypothetical protein [Synergistaceae bacterium]